MINLAPLKALCAAATKPPWSEKAILEMLVRSPPFDAAPAALKKDLPDLVARDAAFIAAARTALPALIVQHEADQAEIKRLRETVNEVLTNGEWRGDDWLISRDVYGLCEDTREDQPR